MTSKPRWLTEDEQNAWRAWLEVSALLPDRLNRDLIEQRGITLADYVILVHLSEEPDRRLRMSDLADRTSSSRSRLSHQIDRMEAAGLVTREVCSDDKRGTFAVLTGSGWDTIVAAAPDHVESVRRNLIDVLGPDRFTRFGRDCQAIAEHLRDT
jgi:DNA-binding MarR family transcriptional regulator